jgi:hypothetical protein
MHGIDGGYPAGTGGEQNTGAGVIRDGPVSTVGPPA